MGAQNHQHFDGSSSCWETMRTDIATRQGSRRRWLRLCQASAWTSLLTLRQKRRHGKDHGDEGGRRLSADLRRRQADTPSAFCL